MSLADYTLNSDDLEAIARYVVETRAVTPAASKLQWDFRNWYNKLGYFEKYQDSTFREASNRRNAFNIANTKTPEERNQVKQVISTGITAEESRGKPRVVDGAGNYPTQKGITVLSAAKGTVAPQSRPTLRKGVGSKTHPSEAVKSWQSILNSSGFTTGIDGIFGDGTDKQTRAWQKKHGLDSDGVVGTATWLAAFSGTQAVPSLPLEIAAVTPVAPTGTPGDKVPTGWIAPIASVAQATKPSMIPVKTKAVEASVTPPVLAKTGTTAVPAAAPTAAEAETASVAEASMIPGVGKVVELAKKYPGRAAAVVGLGALGTYFSHTRKWF